MISGILAESFNNKQMVINSDVELSKRQKECISRFTRDMTNANSNNSNNRGNAYDNIEDVRQSVNSGNPTSTAIPRSPELGSPRLKQENDFVNDDFSNHGIDRYLDSDSDRNEQTHMNEKRFSCEHCGNSFTDPSNLQRHIRQNHAGARAHPCPECGKTFATSSGLKQHQHIHSSIKPFTCEVCRKSYTQFSNLCRHKRMHADCRVRIKCGNCGEYFPTSSALNKHRRFCDAKSLFSDRAKVLDYGITTGSAKTSPGGEIDGSPTQLLRNGLRSLSGTSLLDFTPGRNPSATNSRLRNGIDASSQRLPYLFSYPFPTSGLQLSPNESDNNKGNVGISGSTTPAHNISPKAMPEISTASVQIQCNDPVADRIKLSLGQSSESHNTLEVNSSRFRGMEKSVKYSPKSRHSEAQMSPRLTPSPSPSRIDILPSSAFNKRPELSKNGNYYIPTYPIFRECPPSQLSPPTKPSSERDMFQGAFADNFKRILDEMIGRQKFFNLASAFAKTPGLYRPGMFSSGDIPYASFPYLPQCQGENEQPLDLSLNRLRSELGFSPKTSSLGGEESPSAPPMQKLNSPTEVVEDNSPDIRPIAWPTPLYSPYGLLKSDPNLMRFYGGLHGSLPFGKTTDTALPYALPPRSGLVRSHLPALSPGRMFTMLNSQRRMYDLLQRDYAGLNRRSSSQQVLEHSPNQNSSDIPRSYGSSCQYGFGRGNGRYDREKYVCKYCGKLFPRSANLTRHLRTHTGEQPYSCKYCDRNFSISSNLQRHVRNIHKKERPYCCPLCKRAFGQQTNLERHLRKHLEKPESVVRGNLTQDIPELGPSNAKISRRVNEGTDRNPLSPRHSNDGRSSDWNEESSIRNELRTSSDEDSLDTSLPSNSFSPNNGASPHRENTESLHVVSSEE